MKKLLVLLFPAVTFAANIDIGFSTDGTSLPLILKAINSAQSSICMATYSFTSKPISQALINAQKRGVKVQIVSDQNGNTGTYTSTTYLANNGVDVRLNGNYPIMHNKFIVVDNRTTETGSFNYTSAATKNAENVMVIWNDINVATKYANECYRLYNEATPLSSKY